MSVNGGDVEMVDDKQTEKVAILDAGSQYGKVRLLTPNCNKA